MHGLSPGQDLCQRAGNPPPRCPHRGASGALETLRQASHGLDTLWSTSSCRDTGASMPNITFQPVLREMRDVLNSDFYVIPRFQRPYSWNSENLEDFWRDVVADNEEGYFIGPMVAYRESDVVLAMVDGQQRITSITLLICALRDQFQRMQAAAFSEGLAKYIERRDDDSVSHFVLRSEAAGAFLQSQIQLPLPRTTEDPESDEQKALKRAFDDISRWLENEVGHLERSHPKGPEHSPAGLRLRQIRDKILALQVIWIRLDNEDDAYVIFETLNSRGKDLETVDLLKNLILGAVRAENGDLDLARIGWNEMRQELSVAGEGVNPNTFILHWWLSQRDYTAERKLFRLIRKQFDRSKASDMLSDLRKDAVLYARIANPMSWQCAQHERPVRDSLAALNIFGVRQPRPLLLALLRAHRDGVIRLGRLKAVLRAIESYHFISTAVVGVSSTGGISIMYASHARQVSGADSASQVHQSIDALIAKLKSGVSNRATFISEFGEAVCYSTERPEKRRLVRYVLRNMHDCAMPGHALDHEKCNIEHIGPQSQPANWTADVGNLLWVDATLNERLGNKSFGEKRSILSDFLNSYDVGFVINQSEWGARQVAERRELLAAMAYDKVWKISG